MSERPRGDKTVTWGPDDKGECARAEQEFEALEAAGFNIVDAKGQGLTKFDAKAGLFVATMTPIKPKPKPKAKAKAKPAPLPDQQTTDENLGGNRSET